MRQLDFLCDSKEDELRRELVDLSRSLDNLRKGVFKRHSELARDLKEIKSHLSMIDHQLCVIKTYLEKDRDHTAPVSNPSKYPIGIYDFIV